MSHGYAIPFHKRASTANFDGSSTAKTLWIKSQAISGIYVSIGKTLDETTAGRGYWSLIIEYFTGAAWDGSQWTGGSWNELWHKHLCVYWGATATKDANTPQFWSSVFNPPMVIPNPFVTQIWHPTRNRNEFPNTHNAAEVATETDIRCYVVNDAGTTTAQEVDVNILVPE